MFSLFKSNKSPYYQIIYIQPNGKRTTVSARTKIKSEALKFLTDFKEQVKLKPTSNEISIEEFILIFIEYANLQFSTSYIRSCQSSLNIMEEKFGGVTLLSDLNKIDLEKFLLERFKKSKYGTHLIYRTLKSVFQKAVEWNYLETNYFKSIRLPRLPHNNILFIKAEEFQNIVNQEQNNLFNCIYNFAYETGLRIAEITNLKWEQINFNDKLIYVKNREDFQTKSKKERIIPMSNNVNIILSEIKTSNKIINGIDDYVFRKLKGIKLTEEVISKRFKKCVKKVSVNPKFHFHNLRSSFACNLISKGISIFVVQKLLGHSSVSVTERNYAHVQLDALRDAISRI